MNVKKGVFRLLVVVSVLAGMYTALINAFVVRWSLQDICDDVRIILWAEDKKKVYDLNFMDTKTYFVEKYGTRSLIFNDLIVRENKINADKAAYKADEAGRKSRGELDLGWDTYEYWDFADVVKHKPQWFLLPLPGFLIGFLPIWIIYYTVKYIIKGFTDKKTNAT
jgi:hypothetical protein